jgi:hypothetical protein
MEHGTARKPLVRHDDQAEHEPTAAHASPEQPLASTVLTLKLPLTSILNAGPEDGTGTMVPENLALPSAHFLPGRLLAAATKDQPADLTCIRTNTRAWMLQTPAHGR